MKFCPHLASARLVKRYKRFLTDVILDDGTSLTMHCPNTGSMKHCADPGSRIWYSESSNKTRKYPHTFELVEVAGGAIASINTGRANPLVREAIESGVVVELAGYQNIQAEVKYGEEKSRIDFLLQQHPDKPAEDCYVEVKSVTLGMADSRGLGMFPDAITARGLKHLRELIHMKSLGYRAVLFFCVQHTGINVVEPADDIDPEYGRVLRQAKAAGVEILAYRASISNQEIKLLAPVEVNLPHRS